MDIINKIIITKIVIIIDIIIGKHNLQLQLLHHFSNQIYHRFILHDKSLDFN